MMVARREHCPVEILGLHPAFPLYFGKPCRSPVNGFQCRIRFFRVNHAVRSAIRNGFPNKPNQSWSLGTNGVDIHSG